MMELLVRLANEKYIDRLKITANMAEALKLFWDEHLENKIGSDRNKFALQL